MSYIGQAPTNVPLTSADLEDSIITSAKIVDGAIVNADINASAAIAQSKLSGSFGITEADQWRITTTTTAPTNPITSWERVDDGTFGYLGTGMSHSSGTFTFPSTGIWFIGVHCKVQANTTGAVYVYLNGTPDNSTYDRIAHGSAYMTGGHNTSFAFNNIFDCQDTSNYKVQLEVDESSNGQIQGDTNASLSAITFIKLGDT